MAGATLSPAPKFADWRPPAVFQHLAHRTCPSAESGRDGFQPLSLIGSHPPRADTGAVWRFFDWALQQGILEGELDYAAVAADRRRRFGSLGFAARHFRKRLVSRGSLIRHGHKGFSPSLLTDPTDGLVWGYLFEHCKPPRQSECDAALHWLSKCSTSCTPGVVCSTWRWANAAAERGIDSPQCTR